MVGHLGSSAGSYIAYPTSPIPSHCATIVTTSTLRVDTCNNWGADFVTQEIYCFTFRYFGLWVRSSQNMAHVCFFIIHYEVFEIVPHDDNGGDNVNLTNAKQKYSSLINLMRVRITLFGCLLLTKCGQYRFVILPLLFVILTFILIMKSRFLNERFTCWTFAENPCNLLWWMRRNLTKQSYK